MPVEVVLPRSNPQPRRRGDTRFSPGVPVVFDEVPELIALDLERDPTSWVVREIKPEPEKKSRGKSAKAAPPAAEPEEQGKDK